MEATKLRKELVDYINNADEKLLKEVKALVENYENDQIISHTDQGKPLTREGMLQEVADAEEEYHNSNYASHEQLKEEIKARQKSHIMEIMRADEEAGMYET